MSSASTIRHVTGHPVPRAWRGKRMRRVGATIIGDRSDPHGGRSGIMDNTTREATAHRVSRREFLGSGAAGLVAGATGGALAGRAAGAPPAGAPGERIVLKGGVVLTMDSALGDFDRADVLIEGGKIAAVGPNLGAAAREIDASNMI